MCCNTRQWKYTCCNTSEAMSKRKGKTNIKKLMLCKCNRSYKKLQQAIKSGDEQKIAEAKNAHKQNCARLKTKKA